MKRDLEEYLIPGVLVLGFLFIATIIVMAIYDSVVHPCLRSDTVTCTEQRCSIWMDAGNGVPMCYGYEDYETTCTRCLERKP